MSTLMANLNCHYVMVWPFAPPSLRVKLKVLQCPPPEAHSPPFIITHIPHYLRQVTVVAKDKLSLTRTSRSLFSSLSTLAPKAAAGPALILASRAAFNRSEWNTRSSTVITVQQTRFASNKDKKKRNMPPKKVVEEKKVLLGRPGNNLNAGIVCTNMYVLCTTSSALVAN